MIHIAAIMNNIKIKSKKKKKKKCKLKYPVGPGPMLISEIVDRSDSIDECTVQSKIRTNT
jgi:hypothetical protein